MNEDIDTYIKNTVKLIAQFDDEPTEHNASVLEAHLTAMKLMIGNERFDELPHFRRYLQKASRLLNELEQHNNTRKENGKWKMMTTLFII